MNDPFASICRACGARNAFGPSPYAEEPVAPPPTKRTPMSASAIARWAVAIAAVVFAGRMLLWCYMRSQRQHQVFVEPVTLPTTTPAATKLPPVHSVRAA